MKFTIRMSYTDKQTGCASLSMCQCDANELSIAMKVTSDAVMEHGVIVNQAT